MKLKQIDINDPILPNGEMLDVHFDNTLGSGQIVTVNIKYGISEYESTLGSCNDFKIQTITNGNEVIYLLFSHLNEESKKYNTTICSYDVNVTDVFGVFTHIESSLYYDNEDNIIFYSNGLKADEKRNGKSVELKYHYNISNMLSREIKDERILNILDSVENYKLRTRRK